MFCFFAAGFVHPDRGNFRVGVCAPRHDGIIDFLPQKLKRHEDVSHHHAGVRIRHVGEEKRAGDVACGVNVRLRRLQIFIHLHAARAARDANFLEADFTDSRRATRGNEKDVGCDGRLFARRKLQLDSAA